LQEDYNSTKRVLCAETPYVSLQFVSEPEVTRHICADNIKKHYKKCTLDYFGWL